MEAGVPPSEVTPTREPYERPDVIAIDLQADQVLAVGCKTATGLALGGQPACGPAVPCLAAGS